MRLLGFMLLMAGWLLVIAALVLLRADVARASFTLAGFAVEVLGLVLVFRTYRIARGDRE
jgi:hypothetical protein